MKLEGRLPHSGQCDRTGLGTHPQPRTQLVLS